MAHLTDRVRTTRVSAIPRALIATALAVIGWSPAMHAQEAVTPARGGLGVGVSPLFKAFLDVPSCCTPPSGWVTWGTGKYRLQVDFVRNRLQQRGHGGYYEDRHGQEIVVQRASSTTYRDRVVGAALYLRLREMPRVSPHLLLGLAYWHRSQNHCVAWGKPVERLPSRAHDANELLYRVDFAPGEEQRCAASSARSSRAIAPVLGAGVDIPFGRRFFARVQARLVEVRVGGGLRF